MSSLDDSILILKGVLPACPRIAEALEDAEQVVAARIMAILQRLIAAPDDALPLWVDEMLEVGFDSLAESIFREILNRSRGARSAADGGRANATDRREISVQTSTSSAAAAMLLRQAATRFVAVLGHTLGEAQSEFAPAQEAPLRHVNVRFARPDPVDALLRTTSLQRGLDYSLRIDIGAV